MKRVAAIYFRSSEYKLYTIALTFSSETSQYSLTILPIMKLILIFIQLYFILKHHKLFPQQK